MLSTTSQTASFSLPINPKLDPEFIDNHFIPFLIKHKDLIVDLYFTSRMPPFTQDAMGDVFRMEKDSKGAIRNALYISEKTGIPLSATFNNMWVRPDQYNLDMWINNFKYLWDVGIKIVTLPHTSWVSTGQIQRHFPGIYIKNTILREVVKPNEIVSLASAGFNYINLDRDIMRDQDALPMIKKAKEYCAEKGNPIKLSLLANEHCWGGCPIMPEHYQYNCTRQGTEPEYFNSEISRVSCSRWDTYDAASELKQANLPPWREDWEELLDVIDVFKMHGRESAMRLKESMDIIQRWNDGQELLYPEFDKYIQDVDIKDAPINIWRDKIKTCKFNCWDCNYCESVIESHIKKQKRQLNPLVNRVVTAIDSAVDYNSNFNPTGYNVVGLSSTKVRHFLNNLCKDPDTVYADVGCYMGSTLFAATMGNPIKAYAIDDWSDGNVQPRKDVKTDAFKVDNPQANLIEYAKQWFNPDASIAITDKPVSEVVFNPEYPPNVIFYDADNSMDNMIANLNILHQNAAESYILVVDDANFDGVVDATDAFAADKTVVYKRTLLTEELEDDTDWWNGLYVMVIEKDK
jgi:hypothetical protein